MVKETNMRNLQHIKNWKEGSGQDIPAGYHIHHLVPRMDGGTDDYENLVCVSPELHAEIHQMLGERYDDHRHLSAARLIRRESSYQESVVVFDLDGGFIGKYNSYQQATRVLNMTPSGMILRACRKETPSFGGYQWRFYSEIGDVDSISPVIQRSNYNGGHRTSMIPVMDMIDLNVFRSKNKAAKTTWPEDTGNWTVDSSKFKDRFLELSKDEYKFFKELEDVCS